jgi:16S rRNA C1402 N4-methylase RsmH
VKITNAKTLAQKIIESKNSKPDHHDRTLVSIAEQVHERTKDAIPVKIIPGTAIEINDELGALKDC